MDTQAICGRQNSEWHLFQSTACKSMHNFYVMCFSGFVVDILSPSIKMKMTIKISNHAFFCNSKQNVQIQQENQIFPTVHLVDSLTTEFFSV